MFCQNIFTVFKLLSISTHPLICGYRIWTLYIQWFHPCHMQRKITSLPAFDISTDSKAQDIIPIVLNWWLVLRWLPKINPHLHTINSKYIRHKVHTCSAWHKCWNEFYCSTIISRRNKYILKTNILPLQKIHIPVHQHTSGVF